MAESHTPGPWHVTSNGLILAPAVTRLGQVVRYQYICEHEDHDERSNWPANARLIAAAPDMLAALEQARGLIDCLCEQFPKADDRFNGVWASYRDDFDAAIAKARGTP